MNQYIFDADSHIMESEADIAREGNLKRGRLMPSDAWDRSLNGKFPFKAPDTNEHLRFMDSCGISKTVVYPTRSLSLGLQPDSTVATAIVNGYHAVVKQYCDSSQGRLLPAALALPHDPRATAKEVEKYRSEGFAALTVLPHGHGGLLGDKRYLELYESCEAASMPITVHPNSVGVEGLDEFTTFIEMHTCSVPFILMKQFVSLTFSGIFERYPKLRWYFPEAGAAWLPYWIDRMDKEYLLRKSETQLSNLPSEVIKQTKIFLSFGSAENNLDYSDSCVGGGVVWASDFPHWDHEYAHEYSRIQENFGAEFAERALYRNATSLYKEGN